LVYSIVTAYS
jgi:hypothetical protein